MKHLLSLEAATRDEILAILALAVEMKATRGRHAAHPLRHQCWAMMFSKSSTRTRVSFEVGIRELGGDVFFLAADDIQLGRGEPIKDTARVMGRMCHGAVIRTFAQTDVVDFATLQRHPDDQCADRRRASVPDPRGPADDLGAARRIMRGRWSPSSAMARATCRARGCGRRRSWASTLRIAAPAPYQPDPPRRCAFARGQAGGRGRSSDRRSRGRGARCRCALHRCVGEHGQGGGDGVSPGATRRVTRSTRRSWQRRSPARS